MDSLFDDNCITARLDDVQYMTSLGLESNIGSAAKDKVFFYHRGVKDLSSRKVILILLHGYPQTSHILSSHILSVSTIEQFLIPGLDGDTSSASKKDSSIHSRSGHDRGARVCHRLAVDAHSLSRSTFKGTILMDIVPTIIQWKSFADSAAAVDSYHWPLLANVDLATAMMKSLGAETFIKANIERWAGSNATAVARFNEQDAKSVYASSFKYDSVIRASSDDYRAGAFEDITQQEEDQIAGKKLDVDVLALFSAGYLGSRYNVEEVWREWMGSGVLEVNGFGGGVRHFIAEEAPEKTSEAIQRFYARHG
ncbi:hypothetical protein HYALB_00007541 [Hymenoscyphus albidus]|uniref:AB hydrolase-1 domain-containing protein n=1 Tax=Hymenoscyphus albidus TaxID=595503 RepID=A0A9N9LPE0_9HELO|nr:hypothetical protein HYALB_00007541 [Hymenoscyphus albidus]